MTTYYWVDCYVGNDLLHSANSYMSPTLDDAFTHIKEVLTNPGSQIVEVELEQVVGKVAGGEPQNPYQVQKRWRFRSWSEAEAKLNLWAAFL